MFLLKLKLLLHVIFVSIKMYEAKFLTTSANFVGCYAMSTSYNVFNNGLTSVQASYLAGLISGATAINTPGGYAVQISNMLTDKCLGMCLTYSYTYAGVGYG